MGESDGLQHRLCPVLTALDAERRWTTAEELAELPGLVDLGYGPEEIEFLLEEARRHIPRLAKSEGHETGDEWSVTDEGRRWCSPGRADWKKWGQRAGTWGPVIISIIGSIFGATALIRRDTRWAMGLAIPVAALGLSERLRKWVLDLAFGKEEEFEYTSTSGGAPTGTGAAEADAAG